VPNLFANFKLSLFYIFLRFLCVTFSKAFKKKFYKFKNNIKFCVLNPILNTLRKILPGHISTFCKLSFHTYTPKIGTCSKTSANSKNASFANSYQSLFNSYNFFLKSIKLKSPNAQWILEYWNAVLKRISENIAKYFGPVVLYRSLNTWLYAKPYNTDKMNIVTARPMASGSLLARVLKEVWQVNWDTMGICASSRTSDWKTYCHFQCQVKQLLKYLIFRYCFYIRSNQLGRKAEGFTLVNFVLSVWLKYLNLHPREESRIVFKEDEFYVEFNRRNVSLGVGNFT
jgi:hypothetical protein